jgi:hypothetical protein
MEREREEDELRLTLLLTELLAEQRERVLVDPNWAEEDRILVEELQPILLEVAVRQAHRDIRRLEAMKQAGVWDKLLAWVQAYTFQLVTGINSTTRALLAEALEQFVLGGETMGELREIVGGIFTPERANTIAVTELTRAYSEGTKAAVDELKAVGLEVLEVWHTDNDELVCDECDPLNGTTRGEDWEDYPPLHPNCRCSVDTELKR